MAEMSAFPVVIVGCGSIGCKTAKRVVDRGYCRSEQLLLVDQQAMELLWSFRMNLQT